MLRCFLLWFDSPEAGETWYVGEERTVSWQLAGPDQGCLVPERIELGIRRQSGGVEPIARLAGSARSHAWTVSDPATTSATLEALLVYEIIEDRVIISHPFQIGVTVSSTSLQWGTLKARFR